MVLGAFLAASAPARPRVAQQATSPCSGADTMILDEASRRRGVSTLLCLVNRSRAAAGLKPLRRSTSLDGAARTHSAAMVERSFFSHSGTLGLRRRAVRSGYIRRGRRALLGETIAWGMGTMATPAQLLAAFLESAPHRLTLLHPQFRDAGIGVTLGAPLRGADGPATTVTVDLGRR